MKQEFPYRIINVTCQQTNDALITGIFSVISALIGGVFGIIITIIGHRQNRVDAQNEKMRLQDFALRASAYNKFQSGLQELQRKDLDNAYYYLMLAYADYGKLHDEPNMYIVRKHLDEIQQKRRLEVGNLPAEDEKTLPIRRVGS